MDLLPSEKTTLIGRVLGEYVIRELLGQGGMGVVYRAEQPALAREVVIKVLPAKSRNSPVLIQRFLREARLAAALDHPFAAHVYDFGAEPDGLLWIAMELVNGTPLNELLKRQGTLPLLRFVPFMERLCEVVHAAHEQGIIHRDLKPGNVMVVSHAGRYSPKLLDLGIAKMREALDDTSEDLRTTERRLLARGQLLGRASSSDEQTKVGVTPEASPAVRAEQPSIANALTGELTDLSHFIGTTGYMAPELWSDPSQAGPRSDVYALGVIAFQALAGEAPFKGNDTREVLSAHLGPRPQLGPGFSPQLQAVIDQVLARDPRERFSNAVAFGQALREASGMPELSPALPRLGDAQRDSVLAEAPAPLAEAVSLLEVARSAPQLTEAITSVARLLCWWLGLVALAGRARVGPGAAEDSAEVRALMRGLRSRPLGGQEWLALATNLVSPFSWCKNVHPIPELVALLSTGGDARSPAGELLGLLVETTSPEPLEAHLAKLGKVLSAVSFLNDYPLVVEKQGTLEVWTGMRRRQRRSFEAPSSLQPGEVGLANSAGEWVISLFPFAQAFPPAPGFADELFLLAGPGRRGAKLVAPPLDFERQEPDLWSQLEEVGLDLGGERDLSEQGGRAPFLGLASFTSADTENFFGREREAQACANRLRQQALLAVVGPSGAGKSSFVQAGLFPLLEKGWRTITFRPGPSPLSALEAKLTQLGFSATGLATRLPASPSALATLLREGALEGGVVLFVDQFEELVTLCADELERKTLAQALALAASSVTAPVRVVLAMRDDFLIRIKQLEPLKDCLAASLELLATPSKEDLLRIVVEPARRAGVSFEDDALPVEMVQAVAEQPGALALLSFTALKLWEVRDRRAQRLTRKSYEALGGVGGALAQHAEATLSLLSEKEKPLVREAFRHLVTAAGTRAVLSRVDMEQVLGQGPLAQAVLERLINARLVVTSEGERGQDRVEVIHEALLASWPRLVQWQREDVEVARLRDQLRAAARQWEERGRPRGVLWRGDVLTEYRLWRARYPGALTRTEEAFAASSIAVDTRTTRLVRGSLAGAFGVLLIGLAVVFQMMQSARASLLKSYVEQGRQALNAEDPLRALAYLIHAHEEGARGPALDALLSRGLGRLEGPRRIFAASHDPLWAAELSPDEKRVLTAGLDGVARVWELESGQLLATMTAQKGNIHRAFFSPDGELVATASDDFTTALSSSKTGERLQTLTHPSRVLTVGFSPDGRQVVTACKDGLGRLWDTASGKLVRSLGSPEQGTTYAWFSPDGRRVLTGGTDGTPRIVDPTSGKLLATLTGHGAALRRGVFSHDGRWVVTNSEEPTVRVSDATTGHPRVTFTQHSRPVLSMAFSSDDEWIATGSEDGAVRVWSAASGVAKLSLQAVGPVLTVAFSPDGKRLLTGSQSGQLQTWDLSSGEAVWSYVGHVDGVYGALYSRDGKQILSAGMDGTARLWSSELGRYRLSLSGFEREGFLNPATFATFGLDGQTVIGAAQDNSVRVWSRGDGRLLQKWDDLRANDYQRNRNQMARPSPDGLHLAVSREAVAQLRDARSFALEREFVGHSAEITSLAFSPSGGQLVTASVDRRAILWDIKTGQRLHTFEHDETVFSAAFDPSGERVITASRDHAARLWSTHTGRLLRALSHPAAVEHASFSGDGRRVVTACDDKSARVWEAQSGKLLASLEGHTANVNSAEFSPDGATIASISDDGTVKLWSADSGALLDTVGSHTSAIRGLAWSRDGQELVTAGDDERIRAWSLRARPLSAELLQEVARCQLPYEIRGERLFLAQERRRCQTGSPFKEQEEQGLQPPAK